MRLRRIFFIPLLMVQGKLQIRSCALKRCQAGCSAGSHARVPAAWEPPLLTRRAFACTH
jgi:hypothetical protein